MLHPFAVLNRRLLVHEQEVMMTEVDSPLAEPEVATSHLDSLLKAPPRLCGTVSRVEAKWNPS